MQIAAIASAIGVTGTAVAADNMATSPLGKTPATVGANNRTDSFPPLDAWMNDYAVAHQGRITRDEFMNQMGDRWDRMDAQRRGYLSPDEARGIYSTEQPERPAMSGSQVTPGYMGPGNSRGK
jgi:hypothetical protein